MRPKLQGVGWTLAFLGIFLASRFAILAQNPPGSDAFSYFADIALEGRSAALEGVSVYDSRARWVGKAAQQLTPGQPGGELEVHGRIEYPPLAVLWIRLPLAWERAVTFMPRAVEGPRMDYANAFRVGMAGLDVVLVTALAVLARRLFPDERRGLRFERLLMFVAATIALWPLLYDRLDLGQAMLAQAGLCLLVSRLHYAWSFLLLAAAVHFKLVPVALAPVFLIGSMPAATGLESSGRTLRLLAHRALVLAAMVLGGFLAFYAVYGAPCLGFLVYHRSRGIEIESLYSSVLIGLHEAGYRVEPYYAHGCVNLGSSLSADVAAVAPRLMAASLLAVAALCWSHFRRLAVRDRSAATSPATLAQRYPQETVSYALLALLVSMVTNKVLSPQYFLWLAPLVPLVPRRLWGWRLYQWSFVACCVLTTAIYPYLFTTDLARMIGYGRFAAPTHRAVAVLLSRNLLLLGLTASLAWHLYRSGGPDQDDRPDEASRRPVRAATAQPAG